MNEAAVRILLVYGYEPSGHAAAAFALEAAGRAAGAVVSRVQVAGDHHSRSGRSVARAYHALLRSAPGLWGRFYGSPIVRSALRLTRGSYLSLGGSRRMRERLAREAPTVIVCPQAAVAAVLCEGRRRGDVCAPVVSVLTDFEPHPFWADPAGDLVFAPTAAALAHLASRGVARARLRAFGVPIHPAFACPPDRREARERLSLPSAAPVILVSGGSQGFDRLDEVAVALLGGVPTGHVLALCGASERARRRLSGLPESGGRLRVFGPQPPPFVAALMAASDLHVGKPGGMSAAESLAMGVPMVLRAPFPGQEEGNARYMAAIGAAEASGNDPANAARLCARLISEPSRLRSMAECARLAGRPDAAREIVAEIISYVRVVDSSSAEV